MQYYNDESNRKGSYLIFVAVQVVLLLVVYSFVYTALVAVKLAIAKYHLTAMAYLPVVFAMFIHPVVLYKTRKMFQKKRPLRAVAWMLGWAALLIVMMYAFLAQLVGV